VSSLPSDMSIIYEYATIMSKTIDQIYAVDIMIVILLLFQMLIIHIKIKFFTNLLIEAE